MTREETIATLKANYPDACFEQLRDAVDTAISVLKQPEIEERKEESTQNVPKEDLISRKAAINAVNGVIADYIPTLYGRYEALPLEMAMAIKRLPSAQSERKRGRWIDKSGGMASSWNYCSVCGNQQIYRYDFCPNCGTYMGDNTDEVD